MPPAIEFLREAAPYVLSAAAAIYAWFVTRRRDVDGRMDRQAERIAGVDHRLTSLEQTVGGLPGQADLHQIALQLREMSGDMKAMGAQLQGQTDMLRRMDRTVDRHEEHMLKGGK